ncbi:prolyl oligopeptidase family serine peptidase [Nocardia sp. NPDC046763]|uniref:alpha/beta hydrolase n=1 Tax=Nocardia sp. NPDC046763 TaxID=3155256 RepID=UPI00340E63A4
MQTSPEEPTSSATVDDIPVIWVDPVDKRQAAHLVLWLPYFTGTKEDMLPQLRQLAAAGFVALSFDPWQHGQRGSESPEQLSARVFGDFRRNMWPILGRTALDTLRVIDWAVTHLGVTSSIGVGGISMGGDIAIAAAGLDPRITSVAAMLATPDWLRPGMHHPVRTDELLPMGTPDAYGNFFYDRINPLTNLASYDHQPAIAIECGAEDQHVPPDGAQRFQTALAERYPDYAGRLQLTRHAGAAHYPVPQMWDNCVEWFKLAP